LPTSHNHRMPAYRTHNLQPAHRSYRSTAPHLGKPARVSELNSLLPHCQHLHLRADAYGRIWTHGVCVLGGEGGRVRLCSHRHHSTWTGSAPCGVM
ncbi:MAG: hypothetical protein ACK55Z_02915, partial [bacterium]